MLGRFDGRWPRNGLGKTHQRELARLHGLVEVLEQKTKAISDEGGKTSYKLRHQQTGKECTFTYRDVFDVGPVINPAYPVSPRAKPRGLCNCENNGPLYLDKFRG